MSTDTNLTYLPTPLERIAQSLETIERMLVAVTTGPTSPGSAQEKYLAGRWARTDGNIFAPKYPVPSSAAPGPPTTTPAHLPLYPRNNGESPGLA